MLYKTLLFIVIFIFLWISMILKMLYRLLKISVERIKHNLYHKFNNTYYFNSCCYDHLTNNLYNIHDTHNDLYNGYNKIELYDKLLDEYIHTYISYECLSCPSYIDNTSKLKYLLNIVDGINKKINKINERINSYDIYFPSNNFCYNRYSDFYNKFKSLQHDYYWNSQNDILELENTKKSFISIFINKYLQCSNTYKDLFIDIAIFTFIIFLFMFSLFYNLSSILIIIHFICNISVKIFNLALIAMKLLSFCTICLICIIVVTNVLLI